MMSSLIVSRAQSGFISNLLRSAKDETQLLRPDGRAAGQRRSLKISLPTETEQALGGARVSDKTNGFVDVDVGVSVDIGHAQVGVITFSVDLPSWGMKMKSRDDSISLHIASILKQSFAHIDMTKLRISKNRAWHLNVDVVVHTIGPGEYPLPAIIIAVSAALTDLRLPQIIFADHCSSQNNTKNKAADLMRDYSVNASEQPADARSSWEFDEYIISDDWRTATQIEDIAADVPSAINVAVIDSKCIVDPSAEELAVVDSSQLFVFRPDHSCCFSRIIPLSLLASHPRLDFRGAIKLGDYEKMMFIAERALFLEEVIQEYSLMES